MSHLQECVQYVQMVQLWLWLKWLLFGAVHARQIVSFSTSDQKEPLTWLTYACVQQTRQRVFRPAWYKDLEVPFAVCLQLWLRDDEDLVTALVQQALKCRCFPAITPVLPQALHFQLLQQLIRLISQALKRCLHTSQCHEPCARICNPETYVCWVTVMSHKKVHTEDILCHCFQTRQHLEKPSVLLV